MKKAKNSKEAWDIQHKFEGPSGWIQWKGTEVCMDVYCSCGAHLHVDDDFCYNIKCPHCSTIFMVNGHVELIPIENFDEREGCLVEPDRDYDLSEEL